MDRGVWIECVEGWLDEGLEVDVVAGGLELGVRLIHHAEILSLKATATASARKDLRPRVDVLSREQRSSSLKRSCTLAGVIERVYSARPT